MPPTVAASSNNILNIDEFIVNIENRPAIWNRNYHCNKPYLNQMWTELMEIHKLPIVVLKAKWKGLRDNFRVEYKRIPRNDKGEFLIPPEIHDSKWIYYYALLFLTDHMRQRQPRSEQKTALVYLNSSFGDQDVEQTLVEPDLSNGLIQIADSDDEFNEDDEDEYSGSGDGDGGDIIDSVSNGPIGRSNRSGSNVQYDDSQESNEDRSKPIVKLTRLSLMEMMRTKEMPENAQKNPNPKVGSGIEKQNARRASTTNTSNHTTTTNNSNAARFANAYELSPKSKRPRLSEDSNFNGSSTMDNNLPDDDDYHYLLSLHPYMKQLTASQKLRIRTKIQKIIFKELYKEDIEEIK